MRLLGKIFWSKRDEVDGESEAHGDLHQTQSDEIKED